MSVKDHLGNEYETKKERAEAYGLSYEIVRRRLKRGYPLKEALTLPANAKYQGNKHYKCVDHLGNKFISEKEMCRHWQIAYKTYRGRVERGWTREKALTSPIDIKKRINTCYDHLGIEYSSLRQMAKAYNLKPNALKARLDKGMSIEEALTTPLCRTFVKMEEHIGETIRNKQGYLITCVAVKRIDEQTNIIVRFEDGLEKICRYDAFKKGEVSHPLTHKCIDHLGQEYPSKRAMCRAYNICFTTFRLRIKNGYSIKDALTLPSGHNLIVKDHLGNEYPNISIMCEAYHISKATYLARLKKGYSLKDTLTLPLRNINIKNIHCRYFKEFNQNHYYKCNSKDWNNTKILTLEEIYSM